MTKQGRDKKVKNIGGFLDAMYAKKLKHSA